HRHRCRARTKAKGCCMTTEATTRMNRSALLAAKAGATYVSPFIGRLDDNSVNGIELVAQIADMYNYYEFETQLLAASIRHTMHIIQCMEAGADVVTAPLNAILGLLNHPLTDIGLKKFLDDYKKMDG
ncbi:MAG: hypothetical protein KJ607_01845, partial [Bacteroidetes bacterium]|nr:hypothetical protein [Bacteroidota bacterium]